MLAKEAACHQAAAIAIVKMFEDQYQKQVDRGYERPKNPAIWLFQMYIDPD